MEKSEQTQIPTECKYCGSPISSDQIECRYCKMPIGGRPKLKQNQQPKPHKPKRDQRVKQLERELAHTRQTIQHIRSQHNYNLTIAEIEALHLRNVRKLIQPTNPARLPPPKVRGIGYGKMFILFLLLYSPFLVMSRLVNAYQMAIIFLPVTIITVVFLDMIVYSINKARANRNRN